MGNINSIPVLSQFKSLLQVTLGDEDAARRTQEEFLFHNTFPVLSQFCTVGHYIAGNDDKGRKIQQEFLKNALRFIDQVPIVGHMKSGIHYAIGDNAGGDAAMKSSTRSIGVIGIGAIGFMMGGPTGAVAGGIVGGVAMDGLTTGIEKAINPAAKSTGYISDVTKVVEAVDGTRDYTIDDGIHTIVRPVLDGALGVGGAKGLVPNLPEVYLHKDE